MRAEVVSRHAGVEQAVVGDVAVIDNRDPLAEQLFDFIEVEEGADSGDTPREYTSGPLYPGRC